MRGPHPLPLFLALLARRLGHGSAGFTAALEGLRRYQAAATLPPPPLSEIARFGGVRLLATAKTGESAAATLVVVPSIINSHRILDLAAERSLLRHLASQGHRALLVDWGAMGAAERRLGLAGLVSARLLPLLDRIEGPISLAGYCLGGTLSIAAGQLLGARLSRLALIATPWHFSAFPEQARTDAALCWSRIEPLSRLLGAVPIPLLNPLFWSLDEEGIAAKFKALAARDHDDPAFPMFAAVEDWAGSGSPVPLAAARDLFLHGFAADRFGAGRWRVRGQRIAPERLTAPILDISASNDRIVPPAVRIRSPGARYLDLDSGHVGMIIGSRAEQQLWQPLSNWLHGR